MPTSSAAEREKARRAQRRDLEHLLKETVGELGFAKKKTIYMAPLAPGIRAWLGLIIKRWGETFSVFPNAGVRHDELHETIDALYDRRADVAVPTVSRLLGYLMPQHSGTVSWEFHASGQPEWPALAADLADNIERYALPWMRQYLTLEAILDGLDRDGMMIYNPERRPVALMLLGRSREAGEQLDAELRALGNRTDGAAEDYRRFAQALRSRDCQSSPRRFALVSSAFLEWQNRRLDEEDRPALQQIIDHVTNQLERILGVP